MDWSSGLLAIHQREEKCHLSVVPGLDLCSCCCLLGSLGDEVVKSHSLKPLLLVLSLGAWGTWPPSALDCTVRSGSFHGAAKLLQHRSSMGGTTYILESLWPAWLP